MKTANCLLAMIVMLLSLSSIDLAILNAQGKKAKVAEDAQNDWVVEIEPGIKRYGKLTKFAAVGHSNSFDVAPDGQTIAFASGAIKFWDVEKGAVREQVGDGRANIIEYSSDGLRLYATQYSGADEIVIVYNAVTGEKEMGIKLEEQSKFQTETNYMINGKVEKRMIPSFHVQGMAVSPDDSRLALTDGNHILLFDAQSGEMLKTIKVQNYVRSLVFVDDGNKLIDSSGKIYSGEDGEELGQLPSRRFPRWMQSVRVNPKNTNQLAVTDWNKGVTVYDIKNEELTELQKDNDSSRILIAAFSGNGRLLAGASTPTNSPMGKTGRANIFVWELETGKIQNKFELPGGQISTLKFASTNDVLYSKSHNQHGISEWDLSQKEAKSEFRGHNSPIYHMEFCPEGDSILTASFQGDAVFHNLENGEPGDRIRMQSTAHLASDQEGRYYVAGANYNSLAIYDRKKKRTKNVNVRSFRRPSVVSQLGRLLTGKNDNQRWENFAINHVCLSDDREHVYVACRGQQTLRYEKYELSSGKSVERNKFKIEDIWDVKEDENGNVSYSQLQWQPRTIVISRNGEKMAVINDKKHVFVVDAESGDLLHDLGAIAGQYQPKLYFLGDGDRMFVVANGKATLWDTDTGEQIGKIIKQGQHGDFKLAFDRDETRVAFVAHDDGIQVKVFDLETMESMFSRKTQENFQTIALSPDGSKLALAKNNCQFDVWDLDVLDK